MQNVIHENDEFVIDLTINSSNSLGLDKNSYVKRL